MNIARQQPFSAFVILAALAVATPFALANVVTPEPTIDIAHGIPSLGDLILYFQHHYPLLARIAAGALVLATGLYVGFMAMRLKLYPIKSSLAVSLYGIVVCGFIVENDYLVGLVASLLLALAIMNYSQASTNEYCFGRVFMASFWLGLLPAVYPPGLMLTSGLLIAAILFKRTLREVAVAVAGFVLPALTICYISWGAGGGFSDPLVALLDSFNVNAPLDFILSLPTTTIVLLGVVVVSDILAIMLFISNMYAVSNQSRYIIIFNICMLVLTAISLCSPAATYGVFAILAVPSAILLPMLFIRIDRTIALLVYLLFFATTAVSLLLQ